MSEEIVDRQTDQKIPPLLALREIAAAGPRSGELCELIDRTGFRLRERARTARKTAPMALVHDRKLLILKVN